MAYTVKQAQIIGRVVTVDDPIMDDFTKGIVEHVIKRALDGWTFHELHGYLVYLKRMAEGEDKVKVQLVSKALRTDRWGLQQAVIEAQADFRGRVQDARERRMAREVFYEVVAEANSRIPADRRGGGNKSGRRRKKPTPRVVRYDPEADARAIARHNAKVAGVS